MSFLTRLYSGLVYTATIGAVLSFLALLSAHHQVFDLISHFRVQYIVLLAPAFILAIATKKSKCVLIISLALAIHGYVVTMSMLPLSGLGQDAQVSELTVMSTNVLAENNDYQALLSLVSEVKPDVIAIQEYTHEWHTALNPALTDYPHSVTNSRNGVFGVAIYSKYAFSGTGDEIITFESLPTATAEINLDGTKVQVYATHPSPPVSQSLYAVRNNVMGSLAQHIIDANDEHVIVMGDFNASPWTSHYSQFLSKARLHNARAGFGLQPSWPDNNILFQLPIDHILISGRIRSQHFETNKLNGSDHRVIWSTLNISNQN